MKKNKRATILETCPEVYVKSGWRECKGKDRVLEIRFIDKNSGNVLFCYAMKPEDKQIFDDIFSLLSAYESKLSEVKTLIEQVEG